jgi:hypothetical protein
MLRDIMLCGPLKVILEEYVDYIFRVEEQAKKEN